MTIKMIFDDGLTWSIFDQILLNVYKIDLVDSFKQFNCQSKCIAMCFNNCFYFMNEFEQ